MIKKIFEPIYIGNVYLKNRIVFAPVAEFMQDLDESVSDQQVAYFAERAKGGAGLICQNSYASDFHDHFFTRLDSVKKLRRFNYLTQAVHANGARMALMISMGRGRLFREMSGEPPKAPSATPMFEDISVNCIPYTTKEIYEMIEQFKFTASLIPRAGYDMMMFQGYGGYLIDSFMSEQWNQRTDEFGGSLENRMRFPLELIKAAQEAAGKDFPIIFKMTPDHMIDGGRKIEEGQKIALMLEDAGVAAIQIDTGCYEVWHNQIEPTYHQERVHQFFAAGKVKEVVKTIPVFTQGKVGDPQEAEAVFEEGLTDLVCVGRSFVADPQWANKIKNDQIEDIVPCICCMEGCIGRTDAQRTLSCALDPRCGIESMISVEEASVKKKVIVVGAGPGGIEAALTAVKRGHTVELWEKSSKLCGQLNAASAPPFKKEIVRLLDYYKAQIYKTKEIRLRLCKTATADNILDARPDAVILAIGGVPIVPNLPGTNKSNVHLSTDVLMNKRPYGKRCVVIGAGFVGCETALHLDYLGKDVVLVEMCDDILPDFPKWFGYPENNRMMLRDMLAKSNIEIHLSAKLKAITDTYVKLETKNKEIEIEVDDVALALGFRSNLQLQEELSGKIEVITIGDAKKPAKIIDAVWNGFSATVCL